ncbi:hypothetical protein BDZ91DRAFT_545521 [Kalaharituber pfeilii]|nr:hypothetical protein BDZ91DRAFT_545521 [Kalaharituber pfeilii]
MVASRWRYIYGCTENSSNCSGMGLIIFLIYLAGYFPWYLYYDTFILFYFISFSFHNVVVLSYFRKEYCVVLCMFLPVGPLMMTPRTKKLSLT